MNILTKKEQKFSANYVRPNMYVAPYPLELSESYMNSSQRQYFNDYLLKWGREIIQELAHVKSRVKEDASPAKDIGDKVLVEDELRSARQLQAHYQELLDEIDYALKKLNRKEYGFCNNCEQAIGIRRLEALPIANLCIVCQQLQEDKQKR